MSGQTEAQRRAAARKAKIMARGNAGLARLAQTARGEEADKLYGEDLKSSPAGSAPSSRPETPVEASTSFKPTVVPSSTSATAPSSTSPAPRTASSASTASSSAPPSAGLAPPGAGEKPGWANPTPGRTPTPGTRAAASDPMNAMPEMEGMPDFGAFMQQFMAGGGMGGMGGPGQGGFPALGGPGMGEGGEDPFNGQDPFAALMSNMGAMGGMPGMGGPGGENPFAGMPGMGGMGMPGMGMPGMMTAPPSKAQRLFPIVHALCVMAFTVFVTAWWEPTMQYVRAGGELSPTWAQRWAALGGRTGGYAAKTFGQLPIFYAFATLEAILLATRVVVVKPRAQLHPLLVNFLPMLPPRIQALVVNGSKYLGVAGQTYRDACLFLFGLGCAVVFAEFIV